MSKKDTGENRSEKARETTKKRRPEGDRKMDQSPRSPATLAHGSRRPWPKVASPMVAGFPPKVPFFPFFFAFRDVWSL
ncbi:hypothetical protein MRB53_028532 [Persea americana]|uniref:Uncharacterized protein n=1 Tax=Persea americana TaxID=3435 RepID=A0ACC2KG07_PERAE|nr:hypothetical protein MRB53_028532 [Persea americana]